MKVIVRVEGGVVVAARSDAPIDIEVFDVDALKHEVGTTTVEQWWQEHVNHFPVEVL